MLWGATRRRGPLLVAVAVLVVGAAGGVWAATRGGSENRQETEDVARGDGEAETVRALEAVQEATARASSFGFRFEGVDTTMAYWDEGERRFTGEGAWSADRWRLVTRDQNDSSETIVDGDTVYSRWPDQGESLEQEPWEHWESWEDDPPPRDEVLDEMSTMVAEVESEDGEIDDGLVDQLAVALAAGLYLDGTLDRVDWADLEVEVWHFPDDPTSFLEAIGRGDTPRLVGQSGDLRTLGVTLRASDDVAAAFGHPVPDGELELDVGADDLPVALRLHVARSSQSFDVEVRFSDWNSPVHIAVPTVNATATTGA